MSIIAEGPLSTARLDVHHIHVRPDAPKGRVLLLGGSNFDLSLKRSFLRSPLVEHFECLTYEPRGIGRTGPLGAPTMADYAMDAAAVLDAAGWADALVVGESFGGMTALHLAALAPARVRRLVLASATAGGAGGSSHDISEFLSLPREAAAKAALHLQDTRNRALEAADPAAFAQKLADRCAFETAFARSSVATGGYGALLEARRAHDVWDALPAIMCPALVVAGSFDAQAPLAAQTAMANRLPHGTRMVHPGGHGLLFDGRTVGEAVVSWLTAG
ncbi:MAG: alpha/beta hydrolase [Pseudomonadota bacterium]